MAKATTKIHRIELTEEQMRERDLQEILTALVDNKAAILDTLDVMKYVQDTELLNILRALVAERNEVLHHILTFVDGSDLTRSMKNMLLLFNTLGQLNIAEMEPLVGKLNGVISAVAEQGDERGGYSSLFHKLTDPDLVEGLNTALAILKGLGAEPADLEDGVERDNHPHRGKPPSHQPAGNSAKWIAAAGAVSASLVVLGLLFKKDS